MGNDARQLAILAAIGIDVYCLRAHGAAAATPRQHTGELEGGASSDETDVRLVIAAAAGSLRDTRTAQRIAQLARAIGAAQVQTRTVGVDADGAVAALPDATAYLLIGAAVARACSAQLPIARQQAAAIAVVDDPGAAGAAARRVLWQTLKPLARRIRAGAD